MNLQKIAASTGLAASLAMAGWAVAPAAATAETGAGARAAGAVQTVSSQDRTFMDQASQINLTEISLGTYMRAHATTAEAKHLGASYARDHAKAQASLRTVALRLHVALPTTPGSQSESVVAGVEAQQGKNMDLAFTKVSVGGHKAAIAVFKKEDSAGSDPAVKAYAAHYLPMLQMHLKWAEHAESQIRAMPAK